MADEILRIAIENLTRASEFVKHCEEKYKKWDDLVEENFTNSEVLNEARTERDSANERLEKAREDRNKAREDLKEAHERLDKLLKPQAPSQKQPSSFLPFSDGVEKSQPAGHVF